MGWTHFPGPFPKWDSRLLLMRDFLGLFKPGCWLAQFGDICAFTFLYSFLFSSVAQPYPNLCYPMDCSTPGFPVQHQLLELAQTHVHWVSDTIQPSYPVFPFSCLQFSPASGSFPMSQFFASGGQSTGVSTSASVLSVNIQDWFPLGLTSLISLWSKGLSRVFSNTTV